MLSISKCPDVQFYSLHILLSGKDRDLLKKHDVIDLEPELPDYARTAALVDQLDLVITVDTAIAHLAAALGKPTWILLDRNSDWRWHENGDDSPWYPTVKLFRQSASIDWSEVIDQVRDELNAHRQ